MSIYRKFTMFIYIENVSSQIHIYFFNHKFHRVSHTCMIRSKNVAYLFIKFVTLQKLHHQCKKILISVTNRMIRKGNNLKFDNGITKWHTK